MKKIIYLFSLLFILFGLSAQTNLPPVPPICNNGASTIDDALAINQGILYACSGENPSGYDSGIWDNEPGTFELPTTKGSACHVKTTVTIYPWCMMFKGGGTEIWANPNTVSPVVTVSTPANSYGTNSVEDLRVETVGGIGVLVTANGVVFDRLRVNNAAIDVQFGNNAYVDTFNQPNLSNASNAALYVPSGLSDSGEQINLFGGTISNSVNGIKNYGARIIAHGTSFDFINGIAVDNEGNAQFTALSAHFETNKLNAPFIKNSGCNSYTHFEALDTDFYVDGWTGGNAFENDGANPCGGSGAYGKIKDSFFSGFSSYPSVIGTMPSQVEICGNTSGAGGGSINNIPNQGICL